MSQQTTECGPMTNCRARPPLRQKHRDSSRHYGSNRREKERGEDRGHFRSFRAWRIIASIRASDSSETAPLDDSRSAATAPSGLPSKKVDNNR
jgi:hypothetical protein